MKTIIITQDVAGARYTALSAKLTALGIDHEPRPGVDASEAIDAGGNIIPDHPHAIRYRGRRKPTARGEVGCSLAHYQVWREIAADDSGETWLILEDDADPIASELDLAAVEAAIPTHPLILLHCGNFTPAGGGAEGILPLRDKPFVVATTAYAVSRAGVERLLDAMLTPHTGQPLPAGELLEIRGRMFYHAMHYPVDRFVGHFAHQIGGAAAAPMMFHTSGLDSTIAHPDWWVAPDPQPVPTFERVKQRAMAAEEARHGLEVEGGIRVDGITLAATRADQTEFAKMLVLLREAEEGLATEAERTAFRGLPQTITDAGRKVHHIGSVTALRGMLTEYGTLAKQMWDRHVTRLDGLRAATDEAGLAAAIAPAA